MAEETLNDFLPDLNELENKIGRKTPESLLIWMKEAADCEDGLRSDVLDREDQNSAACDSISDKINNLKQEMRCLRSADVKILRQLVAVHEGIEAMRWLMEDRATLTSSCSSLTGSLSSLATVEEHGPSTPPYRESLSPAFPLDLTEATTEKRGNQRPPQSDRGDSSHSDTLSSESSEARAPNPSPSKSVVRRSAHGGHCQEPVTPANSLVDSDEPKSEKQDWSATRFRNIKSGAETIRRVLLRSSRVRRGLKLDSGSAQIGSGCALTQELEKKNTAKPTVESSTASRDNKNEEEQSSPVGENVLLSYDAQCCWVGTQDDVTYL